MKNIFVLAGFLIFGLRIYAQVTVRYTLDPFFEPADSQKLSFRIANKNFLKNNEYFNPLNEGHTLIGFVAEPSFVYQPGSSTRLEAGASFLKYSGRNGFSDIQPIFRFQYQPTRHFQINLGTLYGGAYHELIEPLYRWELNFMQPVENGLQFLFRTSSMHADVWLQWQKFIFRSDPFQEELTVGTTFEYSILPADRRFKLSVPLQLLVNHHGGQGIGVDLPLQTHLNYAGAMKSEWRGTGSVKAVSLECWLMAYNDMSPQKKQAFQNGFAIYPKAGIQINNFSIQTGYFHGKKFLSPMGETLFHSAVIPNNGINYPVRNLITGKLFWHKQIEKNVSLTAYTETYTDLKGGTTDYNYGVHIIFDTDFFITRLK